MYDTVRCLERFLKRFRDSERFSLERCVSVWDEDDAMRLRCCIYNSIWRFLDKVRVLDIMYWNTSEVYILSISF